MSFKNDEAFQSDEDEEDFQLIENDIDENEEPENEQAFKLTEKAIIEAFKSFPKGNDISIIKRMATRSCDLHKIIALVMLWFEKSNTILSEDNMFAKSLLELLRKNKVFYICLEDIAKRMIYNIDIFFSLFKLLDTEIRKGEPDEHLISILNDFGESFNKSLELQEHLLVLASDLKCTKTFALMQSFCFSMNVINKKYFEKLLKVFDKNQSYIDYTIKACKVMSFERFVQFIIKRPDDTFSDEQLHRIINNSFINPEYQKWHCENNIDEDISDLQRQRQSEGVIIFKNTLEETSA